MEWNNWCRLCARENGSDVNIFIKNENLFDAAEIIQRFFAIQVRKNDNNCHHICLLCNGFLLSLSNYADRVAKVQKLFAEIEASLKIGNEVKSSALRLKYNLQVPFRPSKQVYIKSDDRDIEEFEINKACFHNESIDSLSVFSQNDAHKENGIGHSNEKEIHSLLDFDSTDDDSESGDDNDNNNSPGKSLDEKSLANTASEEDPIDETHCNRKSQSLASKKRIYKTGEKHFECEECHQKFTRESNYVYHIKKSHKGLPPCEFCGKVCKTKQKLRLHLELHLPPEEREKLLYKCPRCDKKFTQRAKVKEHVRAIHLQEKPFICEQCGKNFASQSNLCSHKRTHDNQSRLNCTMCPKIFNNPHKLRFHIKHTHNSTGHPCSVCGQVLKTRKTLRNHMLIHSDVKPFKCNYCGKEFKRDKNLQIHMITHSGLKPFSCRFCNQSYANRSNCKKHEKHVHPIEYEAAAAVVSHEPQQLVQKKLPNIAQLETMLEQLKAERELAPPNS